ncbi:MAG: Nramp family divalent metal transporter [Thaumarchaeota archaeon]|nr:Nramp family divalent metal transporter [Nitrososphaerota archaeon]MDE1866951.1 Nramp family divalent metal transporter [Nitrososphaerota archaeon]
MISNRLVETRNAISRFIAYSGPALIVSIGYMDPGNYGTDIQGGASFGYSLLWIVWLSSAMAMLIQYLSGKLGIATGKSLAEILREKLGRRIFIIPYWLSTEIVVAATDLAEYLGTVIALNLLFNVPLMYAAIFGAVDVIVIIGLTSRRFRLLEQLFLLFVSIISFGYLYEILTARPDPTQIVLHSLVPGFENAHALFVSVGIIGATVMPHVVFLHSSLTKERAQGKTIEAKNKMRKFHLAETVIVLTIAGIINAAILIMSAVAFNPAHSQIESISDAYKTLIPVFGIAAGMIFLITLLSSGLASSVAGTLAGQVVMEGFLGRKVNVWIRRLVTRFINVIPTTVAIFLGFDPLQILVYSQVILSLLIPLAIIPLVIFTTNKKIMGQFVNRKITSIVAVFFTMLIITLDSYMLVSGQSG